MSLASNFLKLLIIFNHRKELKLNIIIISLTFISLIGLLPIAFSATIDDLHSNSDRVIYIGDNGGECNEVGQWNKNTRTCLLTEDVDKYVRIIGSDLTIDGNYHHIQLKKENYVSNLNIGSMQSQNILIGIHQNVKNVILKNLIVEGSSDVFKKGFKGTGIGMHSNSQNIIIENSEFFLLNSAIGCKNAEIKNNKIFSNERGLGAAKCKIFQNEFLNNKIGLSISRGNIVQENILKNNQDVGINIVGGGNKITNNLILGSEIPYAASAYDVGNRIHYNIFLEYDNPPKDENNGNTIEENYWDSFDSIDEGCLISPSTNFCSSSFIFGNHEDPRPWRIQNGWLYEIQIPENIQITSDDPKGDSIDFTVSGTGPNGPVDIHCNPSSNSVFPIGQTRVICSTPNGVVSSFFVTVLDQKIVEQKQFEENAKSSSIGLLKVLSLGLGIFVIILIFRMRKRKNRFKEKYASQQYQSQSYSYKQPYEESSYKESYSFEDPEDNYSESDYKSNQHDSSTDFDPRNLSKEEAFQILEVTEKSTRQEIRNSRNRLINQWHPDKHRTPLYRETAEKNTKLIISAYELLRELGYAD